MQDYRIVSKVGAGAVGEVYRALDTRLVRDVAIKLLPANYAIDPDRLKRSEQKARTPSCAHSSEYSHLQKALQCLNSGVSATLVTSHSDKG